MLSLKSSPLSSMAAASFAFCPSSVFFSRSEFRPEKCCKGRAKSRREIARSQNRPTIISHSSERGSQTHYKSSARNKNPRDTRSSGWNASCLILTAASWTRESDESGGGGEECFHVFRASISLTHSLFKLQFRWEKNGEDEERFVSVQFIL